MRRKILLILGIVVLFDLAFFAAIFLTLPTDSIRHFGEKTIEKQLKYKQSVEIDDLSISPFLNVTAEGFRITPREADENASNLATNGGDYNGYYCAPYVENQQFVIDKIYVNPSIWQAIKRNPAGKFELTVQDGTINGEIKALNNTSEITAQGNNISLNEFALLSNIIKMQIYGGLEFDLRAVLDKSKLAEMSVNLNSANTAMCPKRLKLNISGIPFIELPFTVFGDVSANIEINKDKLVINSLTSNGPDIKLDVKGDIMLKSSKNPTPRLNIEATITPSESWVNDNDMKMIYQVCEKLDDGSIKLTLKGTTKKIKHDCGTPIQEVVEMPVEETPADNNGDKDNKETTDTKADNPPSEPSPDEQKPERPKAAEKKTLNNGTMRELQPQGRSGRALPAGRSRPTVAGRVGREISSERLSQHPELAERARSDNPKRDSKLNKLDENIRREMQGTTRGRELGFRNIKHNQDDSE